MCSCCISVVSAGDQHVLILYYMLSVRGDQNVLILYYVLSVQGDQHVLTLYCMLSVRGWEYKASCFRKGTSYCQSITSLTRKDFLQCWDLSEQSACAFNSIWVRGKIPCSDIRIFPWLFLLFFCCGPFAVKFQSQKVEGDTWQDHNTEVPLDGGTKSDMLLLRGQRLRLPKSQSYDGIIDASTKGCFFPFPREFLTVSTIYTWWQTQLTSWLLTFSR